MSFTVYTIDDANNRSLTLPDVSSTGVTTIEIKIIGVGAGIVTVFRSGSDLLYKDNIDVGASGVVIPFGSSRKFTSDGTSDWYMT